MTTVQGSPRIIQQRSETSHSVAVLANGERKERNSSISSSPSPGRKRLHPTSLNIDEGAPPNKRLHTPTKEEKESIMREKAILYRKLAEAEKNPFLQTIFPFLPFNAAGKFSPVPPLYTLLQQQSPPRPPSSVPSPYNLSGGLGTAVNVAPVAGQPGSVVNSSLGITGLPTPGGSSVGSVSTPPRPSYPSQFYPLMKYPFSPPTPASLSGLSLLSPFNANSVNGEAQVNASGTGGAAAGGNTAKILASSTPKESSAAGKGNGQKEPKSKTQKNSGVIPSAAHVVNGTWQTPGAISGSVQSPLSYIHPSPLSPMMFIHSPYPNSVSSCLSVSSSSGCSSSSETTTNAAMDGGDTAPENDSLSASTTQLKRYAPSEYHVGPHRPWSEKVVDEDDQSEGADNSGRNTPVDMESVTENTVNPGDLNRTSHNLMLSTSAAASSQFNGSAAVLTPGAVGGQPTAEAGYVQQAHSQGHTQTLYPLSVESLRSSSIAHQGYLSNCHSTASVERPSSGVSSMSSSVSSRGSTPEPDDLKPDPNRMPQGSDTFCLVPGRLSLLSSTQKYKVTVDEVRRRLSHPECLNASVLGGILRRAKSKNGGHVLRQRLESIGVSLPPGRRKATELSLLTSLVEGESLHLATDFRRLCNNFFPHSELAQIIARQHAGTPEAQHRISMVKATHLIVSELQAMLNAVGGPSNIRPNDPNNPYPGLTNFGLVTHGFGNPAINTSLNVLQTYLQELLAYYEGRKPIPPPDNGRYGFSTGTAAPPTQQPTASAELHQNLHGSAYHHHQSEGTPNGAASRAPLSSSDIAITGETRSRELINNVAMVLKQEPADPTSG